MPNLDYQALKMTQMMPKTSIETKIQCIFLDNYMNDERIPSDCEPVEIIHRISS
jgi:hypothetical protein